MCVYVCANLLAVVVKKGGKWLACFSPVTSAHRYGRWRLAAPAQRYPKCGSTLARNSKQEEGENHDRFPTTSAHLSRQWE